MKNLENIYNILKYRYNRKSVLEPPYVFLSFRYVKDLKIEFLRAYDFTPLGFYFYPVGKELFENYPEMKFLPYRTDSPFLLIGEIKKDLRVVSALKVSHILEKHISPEKKSFLLIENGIDAVIDDGEGKIHRNEPVQGFILPPVREKIVRTFFMRNPLVVYSYSPDNVSRKKLEIFVKIFSENPHLAVQFAEKSESSLMNAVVWATFKAVETSNPFFFLCMKFYGINMEKFEWEENEKLLKNLLLAAGKHAKDKRWFSEKILNFIKGKLTDYIEWGEIYGEKIPIDETLEKLNDTKEVCYSYIIESLKEYLKHYKKQGYDEIDLMRLA